MRFQVLEHKNGKWSWRIKRKGRNTEFTRGYSTKGNAKRALFNFIEQFGKWWEDDTRLTVDIEEVPYNKGDKNG